MECLNTCLRQVKPCMSLDRTQHAETKFDPRTSGGFLLFQISILNYYIQYLALVWYVPRSRITLNVLLFWPPNTYLSKISWINFWKKLLVQTTNFFSTIDSADYLLCTEIVFDIQNNLCTQDVIPMFCKNKSFWQRFAFIRVQTWQPQKYFNDWIWHLFFFPFIAPLENNLINR